MAELTLGKDASVTMLITFNEGLSMPQSDKTLADVSTVTLGHYQRNAEAFRDGTQGHDVSQNIAALLRHITAEPPLSILDFGCGPGRDLITFTAMGHHAIGLDGCAEFVEMAITGSGCEVWQQDFLKLQLPDQRFDGIFANASLFHIPCQELPLILQQLHATLKPGGVLFSSIPHGHDEEGWNGQRYAVYHRPESWQTLLSSAGFVELEHFFRPTGLPRSQQPWFASVWRRQ